MKRRQECGQRRISQGISVILILLVASVCGALAGTGDPIGRVEVGSVIACAAFSPDGAYLAVGCLNGMVRSFSTESWSLVWEKQVCDGQISTIAFSPDGDALATNLAGEPVVLFLNVRTGREMRRINLAGGFGDVDHLVFSTDGELLACGDARSAEDDVRVKLIEAATGADLGTPIQHAQRGGGARRSIWPSVRTVASSQARAAILSSGISMRRKRVAGCLHPGYRTTNWKKLPSVPTVRFSLQWALL